MLWCIPCGRLEWDEDVRRRAERELLEETWSHREGGRRCGGAFELSRTRATDGRHLVLR